MGYRMLESLTSILAGLVMTALVACEGDDDARADVARYVEHSNAVQQRFALAFRRANHAYLTFSRGELSPERALGQLGAAERTIGSARDELAALKPPAPRPAAARAAARVLRPEPSVRPANASTRRVPARRTRGAAAAAGDQPPAPVAPQRSNRGVRRPRHSPPLPRSLTQMQRALRAIDAPQLLRASHERQLRRLNTSRRLAQRLRRAILDADAAAVARLLQRFRQSASTRTGKAAASRAVTITTGDIRT